MLNSKEFINGNHFSETCDFIIDDDHPIIDYRIAERNCIIFCKTDYILCLFDYLKNIQIRNILWLLECLIIILILLY
jgi:hypothetical protein